MAIHDKTKAQNETIERPTMTHPVRLLNLQGKLSQVTIVSISNFTFTFVRTLRSITCLHKEQISCHMLQNTLH